MAVEQETGATNQQLSEVLRASMNVYQTESRKNRRQKFIIVALAACTYLLGYLFYYHVLFPSDPDEPYAAVVDVKGVIADNGKASFASVAPVLRKAFEDKNAKGVILRINSPGGSPVQSSLIHDLVVTLKAKHNKPVLAVGEDMLTSGAYFVAVSADKIFVNRSTLAGSIGVISAGFGFTEVMERVGVERRVATAGNSKSMNDPFKPQTARQQQDLAVLLEDIHEHFKDTVTAGRGERLRLDTEGLFEGKVWTGAKALEHGLVDELGSLETAKALLGVDAAYVVAPKASLMDRVVEQLGGVVAAQIQGIGIQSPQSIYAP